MQPYLGNKVGLAIGDSDGTPVCMGEIVGWRVGCLDGSDAEGCRDDKVLIGVLEGDGEMSRRVRNCAAMSTELGEGSLVGGGFKIVGDGESDPLEYGKDSNMFRNGAEVISIVGNCVGSKVGDRSASSSCGALNLGL